MDSNLQSMKSLHNWINETAIVFQIAKVKRGGIYAQREPNVKSLLDMKTWLQNKTHEPGMSNF